MNGPFRRSALLKAVCAPAVLVVGLACLAAPARAQEYEHPCARGGGDVRCLELQLFLPTANVGSTFTIDRPQVPRHLTFVLGAGASYATGVLTREGADGATQDVVSRIAQLELLFALGLFEVMEIGLALPLASAGVAEDIAAEDLTIGTQTSLGDVRLSAKVPVLRGAFALSGRVVVTLPTGDEEELLGPGYWTLTPGVVAAYEWGPLVLAGDVSYRMRRHTDIGDLEQDDELQLSAGARYSLGGGLSAIAEAQLRLGLAGQHMRANEVPFEADVGARYSPVTGLSIDLGVGTGLLAGYGAPGVRGFLIARYATEREPCEFGPEDYDGFEDGDYCADADNDGDGLDDDDEECPNDPEDIDGFLDGDGCPDLDNDADGVVDSDDQCPSEPEDVDGHQDDDGCPDRDNDEDGIPDATDECPMEPEDRDEYQDDDGCPEPGPDRLVVTVTDTRILISERIYFDFDRDTIRSVSMPMLDQVAAAIQRLPRNRRIRVDGYSDNAGDADYNLDLSYRRARSVVQYLAGRGVPRRRLEFVGYGVRNPVAPNDSPEGRALNRRVEFTILQPGEGRRGPRRSRGGGAN